MRLQIAAALVALLAGAVIVSASIVLGFGFPLGSFSLGWAFVALAIAVAASTYMGITMSNEIFQLREFLKQLAVWFGIVALVPLVVWYGTSLVHAPPDGDKYQAAFNSIEERGVGAEDDPAKRRELLKERHALQQKQDKESAAFKRTLFWVAYPVGLIALVVGSFLTIQSVGSALMFAGLSSATTGCYTYWDRMDASFRFGSLLVALVVVLAIGFWRFRPSPGRPLVTARPAAD